MKNCYYGSCSKIPLSWGACEFRFWVFPCTHCGGLVVCLIFPGMIWKEGMLRKEGRQFRDAKDWVQGVWSFPHLLHLGKRSTLEFRAVWPRWGKNGKHLRILSFLKARATSHLTDKKKQGEKSCADGDLLKYHIFKATSVHSSQQPVRNPWSFGGLYRLIF